MTKVSKRILDQSIDKYIYEIFLDSLLQFKNKDDIQKFLDDLLSPTEKVMLKKRLAIALMLSKGYTYDQIDHALKVSRTTIMTVSNFLHHSQSGGYQHVVEKIAGDQRREAFLDGIDELLLSFSPQKLYGSPSYERKKRIGKELFIKRLLRSRI